MTEEELAKIPCACVNSDAEVCARWRDGLDTDDPHFQPRRCECACHDRDEDDLE